MSSSLRPDQRDYGRAARNDTGKLQWLATALLYVVARTICFVCQIGRCLPTVVQARTCRLQSVRSFAYAATAMDHIQLEARLSTCVSYRRTGTWTQREVEMLFDVVYWTLA